VQATIDRILAALNRIRYRQPNIAVPSLIRAARPITARIPEIRLSKLVVTGALVVAMLGCRVGLPATTTKQATIQVGPDRELKFPSQAAKIAVDGAIIEIDAGDYPGDSAVWRQNDLTLRGVGGRAHLRSGGATAQDKAIWVIKGNNTRVENIEFSGARVKDHNGAGIRQEGAGLTVVGCSFHDNENGILSGRNPESDIIVERSEFSNNGFGDGRTHNMYIGHARSFTLRNSYVHHAKVGHQVKSRAASNYILYNRIMDEQSGTSSYAIDFPEAGTAFVIGNLIQQGPHTENSSLVNYARKSGPQEGRLYFVNNSVVNERHSGIFIRNNGPESALIANNIFAGRGPVLQGPGQIEGNLLVLATAGGSSAENRVAATAGFVDAPDYDYRLTAASPAIDAGIDAGNASFTLTPEAEYVHPAETKPRPNVGTLDIGAFEFSER